MLDFELMPRFNVQAYRIIELIPEWAKAYQVGPEAIYKQIPIAHAWCNSNPKKAPKKNVVRFLNTWMAKAKEYGNLVDKPVDRTYRDSARDHVDDMSYEELVAIRKANFK